MQSARAGAPSLWDNTVFVAADRPTDRSTITAMADAMLPDFTSDWSSAIRSRISAAGAVDGLTELGDLATFRPGLLGYQLAYSKPDREDPLNSVQGTLRWFGAMDSLNSMVGPLAQLTPLQRRVARAIAEGRFSWAHLRAAQRGEALLTTALDHQHHREACSGLCAADSEADASVDWQRQMATLASCFCVPGAADAPAPLLSPYGPALMTWISRQGHLDIDTTYGEVQLAPALRQALDCMRQKEDTVSDELKIAVSDAVLRTLAEHGVGVPAALDSAGPLAGGDQSAAEGTACASASTSSTSVSASFSESSAVSKTSNGSMRKVRPPATLDEFESVPQLRALRALQSKYYEQTYRQASSTTPDVRKLGWLALLALQRYLEFRLLPFETTCAPGRLTAVAAGDATRAAVAVLTDPARGCFVASEGTGFLKLRVRPAPSILK